MGYQAGDDAWILWGIKFNMYKILLVDDEILVRDAIRENIDWKSLDCELVGIVRMADRQWNLCRATRWMLY